MNTDYSAQQNAELSSSIEHKLFSNLFSKFYAVYGTSAVEIATVQPSSASVASAASNKKKSKPRYMCCHGKQAHICRQCGGRNICKHGVQKNQCVPCGGRGICNHGRIRWQCPDCGGASMCIHRRRKSQCKECGGSAICVHKRIKYRCRDCKSASEKKAAANLAAVCDDSTESEKDAPNMVVLVRAPVSESHVVQSEQ
jgi:hypothetical protein